MSKYLAIEAALQKCDQAKFEKVAGQILHARGIRGISLLGSVPGKYKTRAGVPDAFATVNGDKFTLLAATTVTDQKALLAKLRGDIEESIDPERTGIPTARIDRLYLAFNSVLPAGQVMDLAGFCRSQGIEPEFMSISEMAGDLTRSFPWIARDEFGISIDTGQILSIDAFVDRYDRGLLATPMTTRFCFREEAMEKAIESIAAADIILSGQSGTGKTRFALEVARRCEEQGALVRCVLSQGLPLYEDIARHFSEPRDYVVVVDDANRVSGVEHLLSEALVPVDGRQIKFIFTVRDYAREECVALLKKLGRPIHEVTLTQFTREETNTYVSENFKILNQDFQRQIWMLSRGNARLATMAARQAVSANNLEAIRNVTELYDSYYGEVVKVLDESDPLLLKILAIVGVFRVVRADPPDLVRAIETHFNLREGVLWETIDKLHGFECVDLHGKRVAKCADQILAGYAFYLCFISRKSLPISALITAFGSHYLEKIRDAIYGAMSTMDRKLVAAEIEPECTRAMQTGAEDVRLRFMEAFWFLSPDAVLEYVILDLKCVSKHQGQLEFSERDSFTDDVRLKILSRFADDPDRRMAAATAAIRLALCEPARAGRVLSLLVQANGFGVNKYSHQTQYEFERSVTNELIRYADMDPRYIRLLVKYLTRSLLTEVETHYAEEMAVHIEFFSLRQCEGLSEWRACIWKAVGDLLKSDQNAPLGLEILDGYAAQHPAHFPEKDVLAVDAPWISEIFEKILVPESYEICRLARAIAARFNRAGLEGFADLVERYHCPETDLLDVCRLHIERLSQLDHKALMEERRGRVIERYCAVSPESLMPLIVLWQETAARSPNDRHELQTSWQLLLDHIGSADASRLSVLAEVYLASGARQPIISSRWITSVLGWCGKEIAWQLLEKHQFDTKREWLVTFYLGLRPEQIAASDVESFTRTLAPSGLRLPWLHDLKAFIRFDPRFLPNLFREISDQRADRANEAFRELLDHIDEDMRMVLLEQFCDCHQLLEDAYFQAVAIQGRNTYFDYSATIFDVLMELDTGFAARYVANRCEKEKYLNKWSEDHRDYSRLWSRQDWSARFHEILQVISRSKESYSLDYVAAWLPGAAVDSERMLAPEVLAIVLSTIESHGMEIECMRVLFSGIAMISEEQRLEAFKAFLAVNPSAVAFGKLSYFPSSYGGTGSMVPIFQRRVDFLRKLKKLLIGSDFISHRVHLDEAIKNAIQSTEWMAEREFYEDEN